MTARGCRLLGAAALAALALALPARASIPKDHFATPEPRPELPGNDAALDPMGLPGPLESPHDEVAAQPPASREGLEGPRIELPDRHQNLLDELYLERDGRADPEGSPRRKDLEPGPRRR